MAYEYVNSFLLLLHPHFLIKNGGEADGISIVYTCAVKIIKHGRSAMTVKDITIDCAINL